MKNNSDVKIMLKEAGILFAITLIAGLVLGFVNDITMEPRRVQKELAIQRACMEVFPNAEAAGIQFEQLKYVPDEALAASLAENGVTIGTVYEAAAQDGTFYGHVVEAITSQGYGGDIVLYVGVTTDGTVSGVSILDISETPGLGMKAESVLIPQMQSVQTDAFSYSKIKNDANPDNVIDAISGATITTKAVTNAVNGGLEVAAKLREGGAGNE